MMKQKGDPYTKTFSTVIICDK